jgi:LemA protein
MESHPTSNVDEAPERAVRPRVLFSDAPPKQRTLRPLARRISFPVVNARTQRHPFALATLAAVVVFALSIGLSGCSKYNELVQKDQACQQSWADVETQLQRRYDLIPNIVATVKGSAAHEEKTLAAVVQARAAATSIKLETDDLSDPAKVAAFQKAQDNLKGSLGRLLAVQESYPDLKANAQFHDLSVELEGTENRIARSREQYNQAVGDYNTTLAQVGGAVINKATGNPFKPRVYFKASQGAEAAPTVSF